MYDWIGRATDQYKQKRGLGEAPFFCGKKAVSESGHEGVTDGNGKARGVDVVELLVVANHIVVGFRADKGMAPEVEANVAPEVSGEVVDANVICARGESTGGEGLVEP